MTQDGPGSPSCRVCRQFSIVGVENDLVARAASQGHDFEDIDEGQKYGTGTFGELLVPPLVLSGHAASLTPY